MLATVSRVRRRFRSAFLRARTRVSRNTTIFAFRRETAASLSLLIFRLAQLAQARATRPPYPYPAPEPSCRPLSRESPLKGVEHPRQWVLRRAFRVPQLRQRMYMKWVNHWVSRALPPRISTASRTFRVVSMTVANGIGASAGAKRAVHVAMSGRVRVQSDPAASFPSTFPGRKKNANSTRTTAAATAGTSQISSQWCCTPPSTPGKL